MRRGSSTLPTVEIRKGGASLNKPVSGHHDLAFGGTNLRSNGRNRRPLPFRGLDLDVKNVLEIKDLSHGSNKDYAGAIRGNNWFLGRFGGLQGRRRPQKSLSYVIA